MNNFFIKTSALGMKIGTPIENAKTIVENAKKLKNSKILVTPELSLTGVLMSDIFWQKSFLDSAINSLLYVAHHTKYLDILITVGLPILLDGKLYNVSAIIKSGDIVGFVPKTNLDISEKKYFENGVNAPKSCLIAGQYVFISPFHVLTCASNPLIKIGFTIGDETSLLLPNAYKLAKLGANIICNSAFYPKIVSLEEKRIASVQHISRNAAIAYISCSNGHGESTSHIVASGATFIAECGNIISHSYNNIITCDIDIEKISLKKTKIDFSGINIDTAEILANFITFEDNIDNIKNIENNILDRKFSKNPFIPTENQETRFLEILDIQVTALAHRIKHIAAKGAIVAVSGGLDSTLALIVTHLAIKKLGFSSDKLIAITMPCFGTSKRTLSNANALMKGLDCTILNIPIRDAVLSHFKDINHDENIENVVFENAQARTRSLISLDIANKYSSLFVGTGDLSELALGYCTFAGDHISLYGINAGLPKTLIQTLVNFISNLPEFLDISDVLKDILDTPISPELLPNTQITEDLVGPYKLHDFFIYHFVGDGASIQKILEIAIPTFKDEYDADIIKKWLDIFIKRFFANQFKRSCSPDSPKIGSVCLSYRYLDIPADISSNIFNIETF